jgi:hypothetical protein
MDILTEVLLTQYFWEIFEVPILYSISNYLEISVSCMTALERVSQLFYLLTIINITTIIIANMTRSSSCMQSYSCECILESYL